MNARLVAPFTEEEISMVAHQLGALKSPGPDGFPSMFYHKFWNEAKDSVNHSAMDWYNGHAQLGEINKTFIALIPKVATPESTCQLIQDNIVVAHEAFHYLSLKKKGKNYEAGLKVDMSKAYDRVEWDFLAAAMAKMRFDNFWIHLVITCISTVSFSILLNGKPGASFFPSQGLRQGDPLSPYLFLIISKVLSLNISTLVNEGELAGVKVARGAPVLSHIFFADDSLFFFKDEDSNYAHLKRILYEYCLASGQEINFQKLPSIWGRSKKSTLGFIRERIKNRLEGWKSSSLSLEINSDIAKFWCANQDKDHGMHWKSWNSLSRSKNEGGLGFRDLMDFNLALLEVGHRSSWLWASLTASRDEVLKHARVQILSGDNIRIWTDRWLPPPHEGTINPIQHVPHDAP
ncbi:unnamed protein product [Prunus armeniaca]